MAGVETKARRKRRNRNIRSALLITIGLAGVIAVSAVAPNLFQLLGKSGLLARLKNHSKSVLTRLRLKGEIEFIEVNGKKCVRLTERGEAAFALEQERLTLSQDKRRRWDKRFRLVMFDVPEKRKRVRELLRREMRAIGFYRVQDSAWVYPYDCEEYIALLKADLHIGKDVLYAVLDEIENDARIRTHFGLPPA